MVDKNISHHHTEGPWHLKKRGWMGGGPYVIGKNQRLVADCGVDGEDGSYRRIENVANAKSISKLPDMINLLKKAQVLLESSNLVVEMDGKILNKEIWNEEYNKLISKIKGAN